MLERFALVVFGVGITPTVRGAVCDARGVVSRLQVGHLTARVAVGSLCCFRARRAGYRAHAYIADDVVVVVCSFARA